MLRSSTCYSFTASEICRDVIFIWLQMGKKCAKCLHWFPSFLKCHFPFLPGPNDQEVLLVTIPEFSRTQTACLVNLRTLNCEPVSFSAFSAHDDEESEMNISHWGSIFAYNTPTLIGHCIFRPTSPNCIGVGTKVSPCTEAVQYHKGQWITVNQKSMFTKMLKKKTEDRRCV